MSNKEKVRKLLSELKDNTRKKDTLSSNDEEFGILAMRNIAIIKEIIGYVPNQEVNQ